MTPDSFWSSAPRDHFTARCWQEWDTRMQHSRFAQPSLKGGYADVASIEDRRLQSERYRERMRARVEDA